MPAIPTDVYLHNIENKRIIKAKTFSDCISTNIVETHQTNNDRCFKIPPYSNSSDIYKHSFFVQTIVDWNQLDNCVVSADSVDIFKSRLEETN